VSRYDDEEPYRRRRRRTPHPDGSGYAVTAMVLGIVSCLVFCCPPIGLAAGLAGLACGFAGLKTRARKAAITGLVLSGVGLTFATGFGVLMATGVVHEQAEKANGRN